MYATEKIWTSDHRQGTEISSFLSMRNEKKYVQNTRKCNSVLHAFRKLESPIWMMVPVLLTEA